MHGTWQTSRHEHNSFQFHAFEDRAHSQTSQNIIPSILTVNGDHMCGPFTGRCIRLAAAVFFVVLCSLPGVCKPGKGLSVWSALNTLNPAIGGDDRCTGASAHAKTAKRTCKEYFLTWGALYLLTERAERRNRRNMHRHALNPMAWPGRIGTEAPGVWLSSLPSPRASSPPMPFAAAFGSGPPGCSWPGTSRRGAKRFTSTHMATSQESSGTRRLTQVPCR